MGPGYLSLKSHSRWLFQELGWIAGNNKADTCVPIFLPIVWCLAAIHQLTSAERAECQMERHRGGGALGSLSVLVLVQPNACTSGSAWKYQDEKIKHLNQPSI